MKKFEIKLELLIQLLGGASLIGVVLGSIFFIGYQVGKESGFTPNDHNEKIIQLKQFRAKTGEPEAHFNSVPPLSMERRFGSPIPKDKIETELFQKKPAPIQLLDKQQPRTRDITRGQNRPGKRHELNHSSDQQILKNNRQSGSPDITRGQNRPGKRHELNHSSDQQILKNNRQSDSPDITRGQNRSGTRHKPHQAGQVLGKHVK